jgi:RNA polymerase sigma factor (TIGR02999 family)
MGDLTQLFRGVNSGDRASLDRLLTLMYQDLHELAHRRLSASIREPSMDTTGLVHESYLRLLKAGRLAVTDRNHFLVYSAHVMHSVIVDLLRRHRAERRGGGAFHVTLSTNLAEEISATDDQVVRISEALNELGHSEPRLVQVVELRYFAGLSEAETAEALGIAVRTVRRDWQKARLLLLVALGAEVAPQP